MFRGEAVSAHTSSSYLYRFSITNTHHILSHFSSRLTNKNKEKIFRRFRDQKMNIAHTIFGVFGNPFPSISLSLSSIFLHEKALTLYYLCFYRKRNCSVSLLGSFVRIHPLSLSIFFPPFFSSWTEFEFI